jgi:carboxymethylenebutenolidase
MRNGDAVRGDVRIGTGATEVAGYRADAARSELAVVVAHDWYGVWPHLRDRCDLLADAGISVLAPDLYDGQRAGSDSEAEHLFRDLDTDRARARLRAVVAELRARGARRVGVVGYSIGGWLALLLAAEEPLDAVVAYYAALEADEWSGLECPVQFHFAEVDDWDPPEAPEAYAEWLRNGGAVVESYQYPRCRHGFANADVVGFRADAAALAWHRTVRFLRAYLPRRP